MQQKRILAWALITVVGFLVCVATVFAVRSCSVPDWLKGAPKKGTVIDKRYEPARHYEEWNSCLYSTSHYDPVSKTTSTDCQGGYQERYDDEDWKLLLEQCKEKSDGTKGHCRRGWREVRHDAYDRIRVGTYYDGSDNT